MVSVDPDDFDVIGELSEMRKDFPLLLAQPSKVPGIEYITVENQETCGQFSVLDSVQELQNLLCLANFASEMEIGDDDGVIHYLNVCKL